MADLYTSKTDPEPTELFTITSEDSWSEVTVHTRQINGVRRYTISQGTRIVDVVSLSYEEIEELVSGLQGVLGQYRPEIPGQLRLFDPDNPPLEETPDVTRLDPA